MKLNRRQFLKTSALSAAAVTLPAATTPLVAQTRRAGGDAAPGGRPGIIDTNVHLFEWPFRHLKYGRTDALVAKLRKHGVQQAWAGSFEALFSKDIRGVNTRLVEECRRHGAGLLVPAGSVNPMWPDWEEDLRRCQEDFKMGIVRVHPCYHGYSLEDPEFARVLEKATERRLLVQVVLELEDPRVHHPLINAQSARPVGLVPLLQKHPSARVQLIGDSFSWTRIPQAKPLLDAKNVWHEISAIEGVGGVGRLIDGKHWHIGGRLPIERFVFGSHAPYFPFESALLKVFESPFTREQMTAIMEGNARRLVART
jgi:uncharacterized protein